jgi:putative transposase
MKSSMVEAVLNAADEWVSAQEVLVAAKQVSEETEAEKEAVDRPPAKWSGLSYGFWLDKEDHAMPRKIYKPEEIVAKLRQVDVLTSQGQSAAEAIRAIGVSEVTYYRWRQEFGGLKSDQVKRLKELEAENTRLRRAISDLTLDKLILQEAARGNY